MRSVLDRANIDILGLRLGVNKWVSFAFVEKMLGYQRELRAKKLLKLLKMIILLTPLYQFNQRGLLTTVGSKVCEQILEH